MAQKFPKDRFDDVPADLDRVGALRARRGRGHAWVWVAWCALAVVVIVGAGWIYLRVLDGGTDFRSSSGPSSSAATTSSATPTPAPTVDAKAQVTVLNGTSTPDLAADAVTALKQAGWKDAVAANATSTSIKTTTIYYSSDANEAAAYGIAQTIAGATVVKSSAYAPTGDVVTVVLGSDYSG